MSEVSRGSLGTRPGAGFRGDVQGLRAVAVLLVIAAHARFAGFEGGFVGVDVFFVISGFLITGLLVREAGTTGRISLLDFYARRARRIIPAATVVLVATVAASAIFLPVLRTTEIFTDAIWAAFFAANVRFAVVETDYFATDQPVSPLQHYWSLAVEEQFYVVWPLLLLVLALVVRRRVARGSAASLRPLALGTLGLLTLASFAWSIWATYDSPATAYFSTFTRGWELGLGAVLAVAFSVPVRRTLPRWLLESAAVLGVLGIASGVLLLSPRTAFPGHAALLPVVGAALVLGVGALPGGERTGVARLLSLPPARIVGDWSFSLYLWHFPVLRIAGAHWGERTLSPLHLVAALVAIVGLSALTFHLVEQPFRRGRWWRLPRVAVALYPASVGVLLLALVAGNGWVDRRLGINDDNPAITSADYEGGPEQLSDDPVRALVQASVLAALDGRPVPGRLVPPLLGIRQDTAPLGACDYRTGTQELCPVGDTDAERSLVVIGDSHARAWTPATNLMGERYGYTAYNFVYSGCPASQAERLDPETKREWPECNDFKEWTLATVAELQPDLVLVSSAALPKVVGLDGTSAIGFTKPKEFRAVQLDGMRRELELLQGLGPDVALLANTPKLPREPGVCLSSGVADLGGCLFEAGPEARRYQRGFADVAREIGVTVVDAEKWFCYQQQCPSVVGNYVTMRDSQHMTTEYARTLAEPLAEELGLGDP
ncbi:acyltransferase family protein [Nocardioides sp.]|uniref:acyltransferase family protein n=1 Tax=Nocardioides sp. TaxID=35761 RepID=UPI00260EDD16|nr:acyltransferase family protein [Nocardioides sp.]